MQHIKMYSSMMCPFCHRAKSLLQQKGLQFEEISVDMQPAVRNEMRQKTGSNSVPQIWIGETHIGGCDELHQLEANGQLDSLLQD